MIKDGGVCDRDEARFDGPSCSLGSGWDALVGAAGPESASAPCSPITGGQRGLSPTSKPRP